MRWLELKRGDVLIDEYYRDPSVKVLLVLAPATEGSNTFEWFSLISGLRHVDNMINVKGSIEEDGWRLERAI